VVVDLLNGPIPQYPVPRVHTQVTAKWLRMMPGGGAANMPSAVARMGLPVSSFAKVGDDLNCDYVIPSFDDLQAIFPGASAEEMAGELLTLGARTAVLKMGRDGCLLARGSDRTYVPALSANVVDTTGARLLGMRVLLPDWPAAKISSPPRALETPVQRSVSRRWEDRPASRATRPCSNAQYYDSLADFREGPMWSRTV
jgi:hypothetical protein